MRYRISGIRYGFFTIHRVLKRLGSFKGLSKEIRNGFRKYQS